jgi:hypothetical protein
MAGQMHVRSRSERHDTVPGRRRGQASGSGDGQQARGEAPDAVG